MSQATGPATSSHTIAKGEQQYPGLTDEAIEKVKGLIGVWLRRDVHAPAR